MPAPSLDQQMDLAQDLSRLASAPAPTWFEPNGLACQSERHFAAADALMVEFQRAGADDPRAVAGTRLLCCFATDLIAKSISFACSGSEGRGLVAQVAGSALRRFRLWTKVTEPGRPGMLIAGVHAVARTSSLAARRWHSNKLTALARKDSMMVDVAIIRSALQEATTTAEVLIEDYPERADWKLVGVDKTDAGTMLVNSLLSLSWTSDAFAQLGVAMGSETIARMHALVGALWSDLIDRPAVLAKAGHALAYATSAWSLAMEQEPGVGPRLAPKTLWLARQAVGRGDDPALHVALAAVAQATAAVAGVALQLGESRDARAIALSAELFDRIQQKGTVAAPATIECISNIATATALSAERHQAGSADALRRVLVCLAREIEKIHGDHATRAARVVAQLSEAAFDLSSDDRVSERSALVKAVADQVSDLWAADLVDGADRSHAFHALLARAGANLSSACDVLLSRGLTVPRGLQVEVKRLERGFRVAATN